MNGCQPPRPRSPLPASTTLFTQDYFPGTVLSGPIAGPVPVAAPIDSFSIHVTFLALEKVPATAYPSG